AVLGKAITIYGDGKQVRDMLHVNDLIAAYDAAIARRSQVAGQIFNMGGGPAHTLSIWAECGPLLEEFLGRKIPVEHGPVRPGDQAVYISDIRKAMAALGWQPQIGVHAGTAELVAWVEAQRALFQ